jgi:peroxiredoxin
MYRKIVLITAGAAMIGFYSCKQQAKGVFQIEGTFKHADQFNSSDTLVPLNPHPVTKLYLQEVSFGKDQPPAILDSIRLAGIEGKFNMTVAGKPQGIYELVFGDNALAVPLINDASEIKVDVDLGKKDAFYQVSGSEASKQLESLIDNFGKRNFLVEKSFADLDSLKRLNGPDSVMIELTQAKNDAIKNLNDYLKNFLQSTSNGTLAVLALGWSSRSLSKNDFEMELTSQEKKFPENSILVSMKKNYDQQEAQMEHSQQAGNWVGKQAPDLALPDPDGKTIALSSFRGKWLLVDFWASWCGPCRMENPNVVKAFNEFKNKNFTILGVSLDKQKDPWQQAIQQDRLAWTHVSDLKFWNSKAVEMFKFEGIPFNILVDPQGKIIAQELRGEDLENKLKQVLN